MYGLYPRRYWRLLTVLWSRAHGSTSGRVMATCIIIIIMAVMRRMDLSPKMTWPAVSPGGGVLHVLSVLRHDVVNVFMVPAPSGGSPPRRQRQGLREKVRKSVLWDVVNPASNPWVSGYFGGMLILCGCSELVQG